MFSLEGHVALVTGSSKGLGKAIAKGLGLAGAKVAINFQNNAAKAEETAAELRSAGCKVALVRANVIDAADVQRLCATVAKELGPIDILVPKPRPTSRSGRSSSTNGTSISRCWTSSLKAPTC